MSAGSQVMPASSSRADVQVLLARVALYVAVAYITLTTTDIYIGHVPLKLFTVVAALVGWAATERPWNGGVRYSHRFAIPVLLGGMLLPVAWFVVSLWLRHQHDPAQTGRPAYAVQEASRFLYLLLYFPILAEVRRCAATASAGSDRHLRIHGVWLWPTLALSGITLLFFLGHELLGLDYRGSVGPFHGRITVESTGTFRAYLIDDVMLIPALALLLGCTYRRSLGRLGLLVASALLATAYLSHTRGIWLGVMIAAVVVLLLPVQRSLVRHRRALAWALAFLFMGAFVINADPRVSNQAASLVTQRNELSTSYRLSQAPQLLHGFERHLLLGSGLGATLPSGYRRDDSEPWSFELSYLQLLFQVGIVGIALALTAPAWAAYRGIRAYARIHVERGAALAAAVGGMLGFLFTSGSNPYLITSVGMLALAVLLVMVEHSMTGNTVSHEYRATTASVSLRDIPLAKALAPLASYRPSGTAYLMALVAVLGVAEFARTRRGIRPEPGSAPIHKLSSPLAATGRVFSLPIGGLATRSAHLVVDASSRQTALWSVTVAKRALYASRWQLGPTRVRSSRTLPVGLAPRDQLSSLGIVSMGKLHPNVLAVMTEVRSRVRIELRDMTRGGHVLLAGATPPMPLARGVHRDLEFATWTGKTPDLIVVDRAATNPTMRVRVFSPASRFHDALLDVIVPRGPFGVNNFSLLAGPVNSSTADLVLVSRRTTKTGHTEIHVLLGPHAFQIYGQQSPVKLPDNLPAATTFLLGREKGLPVLYAANRTTGVLRIVALS